MKTNKKLLQNLSLSILGLLSITAIAQTPCNNGMAGPYPCNGYDLQSEIDLNILGSDRGSDSWGWTDPQDGKEYAIIGLGNGTAFIDISDPINPVYLAKINGHTGSSTWRDIKVYQNHAYIVTDVNGDDDGMQVFDLTRLRDISNPPQTLAPDNRYTGFGDAHNIVINEDTGFAYAVGTSTFNGGGHFIDLSNPANPVAAGGSNIGGYTHDAQVVIYDGPDNDYNDGTRELYFGSNEDKIVIIDVTNKNNPSLIKEINYSNDGYTHQGWLTEDHRYFILGDELDERDFGFDTRTIIFDLQDLDAQNPPRFEYFGPTEAIDHNAYVRGDQLFLSNYKAGLRVLDISDIENNNIVEEGFFDTFPGSNSADFEGAWSVYPYFASGNIVISDINRGFILVKDPNFLSVNDRLESVFSISPNPATTEITVKSEAVEIRSIEIFNVLGQKVVHNNYDSGLIKRINISQLNSGMYLIKINRNTVSRLIKN